MKKVEIQNALEAAFAARSKRVEIDQDLVIRELAAIASIDVRKLFAEDGTPQPIYDLPEEAAAAISSLEMVKRRAKDADCAEYVYRMRFWDKIRALELLGRHLGMFSDRVEVTGKNGEPLLSDMSEEELIARLMAKRRPPRGQDTDERRRPH